MKLIACQFYIADLGVSTPTNKKSSEYTECLQVSTSRDLLLAWKQFLLKNTLRLFELWVVLRELHKKKLCWPGAIIGDWDRKSWDAPGPMIWDNFSIFRTNCAILTSFIRAAPRTCRGFSRGCCHVAWSKIVRVASFHSDGRELSNKAGKKNQGSSMHFYTLSYWTRWVFQGRKFL